MVQESTQVLKYMMATYDDVTAVDEVSVKYEYRFKKITELYYVGDYNYHANYNGIHLSLP